MDSVTELIFDEPVTVCEDCNELMFTGDWPFCASVRNPEGHTKGTYGWKMKMGMKVQGWTRRQE
jgi:hypothetical protein